MIGAIQLKGLLLGVEPSSCEGCIRDIRTKKEATYFMASLGTGALAPNRPCGYLVNTGDLK